LAARLTVLGGYIRKMRSLSSVALLSSSEKKLKRLRRRVRSARFSAKRDLKLILQFASANSGQIQLTKNPPTLEKQMKKVKRGVRRSLNVKSREFNQNRKRALRIIKKVIRVLGTG
jgi:hypothetical protein